MKNLNETTFFRYAEFKRVLIIKRKLIIVSNRLPITIQKKEGKLLLNPSIGGLATGLSSFYKDFDSIWVGWPGISTEEVIDEIETLKSKLVAEFSCYPIYLSQKEIQAYQDEFCNKSIWPLFHYFSQFTEYNNSFWEIYKRINELFCDRIAEIIESDELIWIHDYHLMLLPKLLRAKLPDPTIGFFLHIPFPSFEIFRLLPWRKEILEGLLGSDLIGFHTYDYARHFLTSVHRLLGLEVKFNQIFLLDRMLKVDSFPMGIDYEKFSKIRQKSAVQKEITNIRKKMGNLPLIFSIDRLDYTKGIPQRLEAFELFLEKHPEFIEKVKFVCVAVPSRINVDSYMALKKQVDELVGRINGKYGTIGWTPIWYLSQFLPFDMLAALYCIADVALVTPTRDGMNLIAKEYIASKTTGRGVLILSETAGAAKELGEAIQINVNNRDEIVEALEIALTMKPKEQIKHNRTMQKRLKQYNIEKWAQDYIDNLILTKNFQKEIFIKFLSFEKRKELIETYLQSDQRLILLNYEDCLISASDITKKSKPPAEITKLLKDLSKNPNTKVVLLSKRNPDTLDKWFKGLNIELIAIHGLWIKNQESPWKMIEPLDDHWKGEIRPILEQYTARTPGSLIEEEDFVLEWHYRNTDPDMGFLRARELGTLLINYAANYNLQIQEGDRNISIRNAGIKKGRAAMHWISEKDWNFILAIGSDWSDEELFNILPESAYSIRVGLNPTQAQFNVPNPSDIRLLLKDMIKQMPFKYQIKELEKQIHELTRKITHLELALRFQLDYYSKSYWQHIKSTLIERRTLLEKKLNDLSQKMEKK